MSLLRPLLYVDDDIENLSTLKRVLRGQYEVTTAVTASEALARMERDFFPVAVADQRMPKMTGVEFLKEVRRKYPECVGLLLTAYADMDALVDGVNANVIYRYLTKPWNETDLLSALHQAYEHYDLRRENRKLLEELKKANAYFRQEIDEAFDFSALAGADQGLKQVAALVAKVAPTDSAVLIRGESGVGKELVARAIHQMSSRKEKPFVRVNCGALAEGLLESELFGHEKGAFTGAEGRRIGRFEFAEGGTIFLDEVGDLSPKLQVNLLRVLQEKEFERVGGNETIRVDVRVIAATHRHLEELTKAEKFRQDLFFRLNVFPVTVPPLRERIGDLAVLVPRLLEKAAKQTRLAPKTVSKPGVDKLKGYDWPGNIRELENVVQRALILSTGSEIGPDDLILGPGVDDTVVPAVEAKELTREQLVETIQACGGNKLEAARKLGIKRPTLYYHLKRFGL
ncbi:MAG: sigma-54 dependent transcriptional regulator [Pseudomonadota bacterium]